MFAGPSHASSTKLSLPSRNRTSHVWTVSHNTQSSPQKETTLRRKQIDLVKFFPLKMTLFRLKSSSTVTALTVLVIKPLYKNTWSPHTSYVRGKAYVANIKMCLTHFFTIKMWVLAARPQGWHLFIRLRLIYEIYIGSFFGGKEDRPGCRAKKSHDRFTSLGAYHNSRYSLMLR